MIRRSPRLALRGHIPPDGHGNAAGQRMFSRNRRRNQHMGDASSAFEADISDISRSSSVESLIPDKPCAIATMLSCLASLCHSMKSGIMCLYFLFLSRRTVCMKMIAVLLLLLFGVWFGYRQTQMENGVKFLTKTVEKQKLENKKLQTDMQEMLILMRKIDSAMYKLHMASEQLRVKVKSQKSECMKEAERIVHRALSLHRANGMRMALDSSGLSERGVWAGGAEDPP
ncbi:uncharacterized protein LOC117597721 [Pangasianodon hypophthalmus]|uniref:uncharacterized protein LOC117597721 n=1 Tax=Pangasianodon hypophthalmus TaxID=310915 RepID=UPI002307D918|nr:uncharacterized protein LOC117597721 [Pangasianodon hypophthalmus]